MAARLGQIPEQADGDACCGCRAEARGAVGERRYIVERHIAHIGKDLLPELRLGPAADDAQLLDLLLFAHDVQDLAQAAGRALQNGAEEMLPLVRGVHTEENALRLRVEDGRALALQIRQVDKAARACRSGRRSGIKRTRGGDLEQIHGP